MFNKKTIRDVDLSDKRVLLRADYNVPIEDGKIADDYRINQSLPTVEYILQQGASLVIASHLGRPEGQPNPEFSLRPVASRLKQVLGKDVVFANDCVGEEVKNAAKALKKGQILMLENVRFHSGEEKDDPDFAKQIAEDTGAQVFVQDGFGVVHRAHATTHAIAKLLPSVSGFLLEKEVGTISRVMQQPERPLLAIIGGAKISDKIEVLNKFIDIADAVAVVGAMANNFLLAEGHSMGKSLVEKNAMEQTEEVLKSARQAERSRKFSFILPVDTIVSTDVEGRKKTRVVDLAGHFLADVESYPKTPDRASHSVLADELVLDIGPASAREIAGAVKLAKTVVWNGTCGVTETKGIAGAEPPFSHGTRTIVEAMVGDSTKHANRPFTLVGGGDTVGYVEQEGIAGDFDHVSTGGGASLELMAGKKLPGVEVLQDK